MNERGQKIFKWVVWIILVCVIGYSIWNIYQGIKNPKISEARVLEIVDAEFGSQHMSNGLEGNRNATGKFTALAIVNAIGESNVEFMTGKAIVTDEEKISFAVENDFINKRELDKNMSEKSVQDMIDKAQNYYFDLDNYPESYDVTYSADVVDVTNWNYNEFSEDDSTIIVSELETVPTVDQVIMPRDKFGIAKPRYVTGCNQLEDGSFELTVEKISKPEDLYTEIEFAGMADFSYLLAAGDNAKVEGQGIDTSENIEKNNNPFAPITVYAAKTKEFKSNADIEVGGAVSAKVEMGDDNTYDISGYLKVEDDEGKSSKYSIKKNNKGKLTLSAERNNTTLEAEREANNAEKKANENANEDENKFETEASGNDSFSYKVKLEDLRVAASYRAKGKDKDKFVDIRVTSDVKMYWSIEGEFEGKVPIAEIELPVHCTGGLVCVNLRLYFVVDASGEVTLVYEMDEVYTGMRVSKDGFTRPHGRNEANDRLDITAKVEAGMGFCGEAAVTIGDWLDIVEYDIIDPCVEVKMNASAEMLEKNEGFEEYEHCVQTMLYGPTVKFEISAGEDSLLYWLLDLFDLAASASYDFITEDNAPWKKEYHIETELDSTINVIEGSKENCTHIKIETEEFIVDHAELARLRAEEAKRRAQEAARRKAEEAKRKSMEELEKAIEEAIEIWMMENCGGC